MLQNMKGMDWTNPALNRATWRTLVNTVMNLQIPQNSENPRAGFEPLASQEEMCSTELCTKLKKKTYLLYKHKHVPLAVIMLTRQTQV